MISDSTFYAEYDRLPEGIKSVYSFAEYSAMPFEERNNIQESECMPDCEED